MGRLKSGFNLETVSCGLEAIGRACLLVFLVAASVKGLILAGDVDPKTTLSTYRAGAFDNESEYVIGLGWWWEIDVCARDIWSSTVGQWQEVDIGWSWLRGRRHVLACWFDVGWLRFCSLWWCWCRVWMSVGGGVRKRRRSW